MQVDPPDTIVPSPTGSEAAAFDAGSLERLHDIVPTAPVGAWPLAPGWWVVLAALSLLALWGSLRAIGRWRAAAYRRAAGRALDDANSVPEIAEVLKRTALSAYDRREVAGASGEVWLAFLDRTGRTDVWTRGPGARLPALCHDPRAVESAEEREALRAAARAWIRDHRAPSREVHGAGSPGGGSPEAGSPGVPS